MVLATSFPRIADAASNSKKSREEELATAYSTSVRADVELAKAQAAWVQTLYTARKMHAETLKTLQQVRAQHLDNQVKTAETFYTKRDRREQYRAKQQRVRPDLETYVRVCSASRPQRLLKYQLDPDRGIIHWPALLQRPEFDELREQLDALFAPGSTESASPSGDLPHKVDRASREMREKLQTMVRDVNQMEYAAAKKFIKGLAYEARYAPQLGSVAVNAR
jgi:hypothetical protein